MNQVLINKRGLSSVRVVRAVREQNNDSDHFLLRVKYKWKIKKIRDYKYGKRKKWCLEKVDDRRFAKKYKKNYKKNDKRGVSHLVKEEWHNIKQSIIAVTKEITGGKKKTQK